jgi:hypothetical protein
VPTVPDRSALPDPGKPKLVDHGEAPIDQLTPEQVVHDTHAELYMSMPLTSVGAPGVAATWQLCSGKHCRFVLTVSDDNFARAGYLDVTHNRSPLYADAGNGAVIVADGSFREPLQLLRPDGTAQEIRADRTASPLRDGEGTINALRYLDYLQTFFGSVRPIAVNTATATTHPVPGPDALFTIGGLQPNGVLEAYGQERDDGPTLVMWSSDGGSTWGQHIADPDVVPVWLIATTSADTLAFGVQRQGRDSLDWSSVLRTLDDGESWDEAPVGRADDTSRVPQSMKYGAALVLPDHSLLMSVQSWSDDAEPGIYRSAGDDWTTLQQVDADLPSSAVTSDTSTPWYCDLQAPRVDPDSGDVTLYARDWKQQLFTSIDEGQTWTEVRAR